MPADKFASHPEGTLSPYTRAVVLTKSDSNETPFLTRALYVGGTGDLTVTMANDVDCVISAVPVGTLLPLRIKKLKNATTATLVVALD